MARQSWAQKNRKQNINWVLSKAKSIYRNEGDDIPEKKLVAKTCMELGVTRRKAKEYVKTLVEADMLERNEGVVSIPQNEKSKIDKVRR